MRHGETQWNVDLRYQGSTDIPLTDEGVRQADLLARRMSTIRASAILSSPLVRARVTADAVAARQTDGARVELRDGLCEYHFGEWEGKSVRELASEPGSLARKWWDAPFSFVPPGAEPRASVIDRTSKIAREAASGAHGSSVFIVAHGVIVRLLLSSLLGIDDLRVLWRFRSNNCSVSVVEISHGRPWLLALNDSAHLSVPIDAISSLSFP